MTLILSHGVMYRQCCYIRTYVSVNTSHGTANGWLVSGIFGSYLTVECPQMYSHIEFLEWS